MCTCKTHFASIRLGDGTRFYVTEMMTGSVSQAGAEAAAVSSGDLLAGMSRRLSEGVAIKGQTPFFQRS